MNLNLKTQIFLMNKLSNHQCSQLYVYLFNKRCRRHSERQILKSQIKITLSNTQIKAYNDIRDLANQSHYQGILNSHLMRKIFQVSSHNFPISS